MVLEIVTGISFTVFSSAVELAGDNAELGA